VRRQIATAARSGFTCGLTSDIAAAYTCIRESQARAGFDYGLREAELVLALSTAGPETFRVYVCYGADGTPAAARVILHQPGGQALDWLVGTRYAYLSSGATQYLLEFVLSDLAAHGALGFDFEGANLPGVAASKATWGGRLVPFFVIEPPGSRSLARHGRDHVRFQRRRHARFGALRRSAW
jgi:hypothetical protein